MDICLAWVLGAALVRLPSPVTLAWEHSVEHVTIEEEWEAVEGRLVLRETRVGGPGAGIDIPEDARRVGAQWRYAPALPPQREVQFANSRHAAGYRVCAAGECRPLRELAGVDRTVVMTACHP